MSGNWAYFISHLVVFQQKGLHHTDQPTNELSKKISYTSSFINSGVKIKGILWWARGVSKTLGQGLDIANCGAYRWLQMQCNPIFCLVILFVCCSCCILTVVHWLIHFVNCEFWNHRSRREVYSLTHQCLRVFVRTLK